VHQQSLVDALSEANQILILKPENQDWDIDALFSKDSLFQKDFEQMYYEWHNK
jgi:UDP-N-acetylmuramate: L-alanyl-gamma-D-glutamyl-meso-diaminopimelate ligase